MRCCPSLANPPKLPCAASPNGLDLDGKAILAAMNAPEVTEAITRTRALAQQLSISGTPSFVVDTELLRGYLPADAMLDMVKEIRAERG